MQGLKGQGEMIRWFVTGKRRREGKQDGAQGGHVESSTETSSRMQTDVEGAVGTRECRNDGFCDLPYATDIGLWSLAIECQIQFFHTDLLKSISFLMRSEFTTA